MFKKFLHNETTIIGLKSLGLSTTKQQKIETQKIDDSLTIKKIQSQQDVVSSSICSPSSIDSSIHLNFARQPKTIEGLFGREVKLNLNK